MINRMPALLKAFADPARHGYCLVFLIRAGLPLFLPSQYSSLLKSTTLQVVSSHSMPQNGQCTTGSA
jgi:hypothetical protein